MIELPPLPAPPQSALHHDPPLGEIVRRIEASLQFLAQRDHQQYFPRIIALENRIELFESRQMRRGIFALFLFFVAGLAGAVFGYAFAPAFHNYIPTPIY